MSDFGSYWGNTLLTMDIKPRTWLVEKLIREKDSVILVGNEKSGKSLFLFQLVCSLTSQHSFLDKYGIPRPCKVHYFQLEGELSDSVDRIKRLVSTHDIAPENFLLDFYSALEMQDNGYRLSLEQGIKKKWANTGGNPDIIIFDPIYFSFTGSLSDDEVVRKFISNLRYLKEALDCAVLLVHHTHKTKFSNDGFVVEEGDDAIFGSRFLKAWADHILLFTYDKRRDVRILSCATQRSGDIIKEATLKLVEPNPLYFEITQDNTATKEVNLINLLRKEEYKQGLTKQEIMDKMGISESVFYKTTKILLAQRIIKKTDVARPTIYTYNEEVSEV